MILATTHHVTSSPSAFDLARALPFVAPLLLLFPLLAFAVIVTTFRTRRSAYNTTLFFAALTALATLFLVVALARRTSTYSAAYQWVNVPLAFSGPPQFQGFGIDIAMQLDRAALLSLAAIVVIALGTLAWSRLGARGEPGPVRFFALYSLALLGALGVAVSGDLAELTAFWGVVAVASYLLLSNRWGTGDTRSGRLGLAVPAVGDVALLAAVSLLYSRYGRLDPAHLYPVLHQTPGWGLKSLTAAACLLGVAAAARSGVFPFAAWLTNTPRLGTSAAAFVHGTWAVLAAVLLYRTLPIFAGAGPQALAAMTAVGVLGVVIGLVLVLMGNRLRWTVAGLSSAQASLALVAFAQSRPSLAFTMLLSGGLARAGALLAAGNFVGAMRSDDMAEMGEGLRRLRVSALGLLAASAAFAVSGIPPLAATFRTAWLPVVYVVLLAGLAVVALRPFLGVSVGPLPRRRAFDPNRAREGTRGMAGGAFVLGIVALALAIAGFVPDWSRYIESRLLHSVAAWLLAGMAAVAVGLLAGAFLFGSMSRRMQVSAAGLYTASAAAWANGAAALSRGVGRPGSALAQTLDDRLLAGGEASLGSAFAWTGRRTAMAIVMGAAVAVAFLVAVVGAARPAFHV